MLNDTRWDGISDFVTVAYCLFVHCGLLYSISTACTGCMGRSCKRLGLPYSMYTTCTIKFCHKKRERIHQNIHFYCFMEPKDATLNTVTAAPHRTLPHSCFILLRSTTVSRLPSTHYQTPRPRHRYQCRCRCLLASAPLRSQSPCCYPRSYPPLPSRRS